MSKYKPFENKMTIEEAIEEFDFFNEGDYITRKMSKAKDIVLKELQDAKSDLYEANNRIADLLDIAKQRKKMIDLLVRELYKKAHISTKCYLMTSVEECMKHKNCYECLKKYFEERCK